MSLNPEDCKEPCKNLARRDELEEQFKKEVNDRAEEVDPGQEEDWKSLTLGWAIAKGLSPQDAITFALHIRYHTELG